MQHGKHGGTLHRARGEPWGPTVSRYTIDDRRFTTCLPHYPQTLCGAGSCQCLSTNILHLRQLRTEYPRRGNYSEGRPEGPVEKHSFDVPELTPREAPGQPEAKHTGAGAGAGAAFVRLLG